MSAARQSASGGVKRRRARTGAKSAEPFNGVDLIGLEDRINGARNAAALCWLAVPTLLLAPSTHGMAGIQAELSKLQDALSEIGADVGRARAV